MTPRACVALAFAALAANVVRVETPLFAAQNPDSPVIFEAASVKPNKSGEAAISINSSPGGRFTATNAPLRLLILQAFQLTEYQLLGAPDGKRTDRFDVNATLNREPPATLPGQAGERQLALRALLADQFKLVAHAETREFPIYAITMVRADRKPGPKLMPSSTDCSPAGAPARAAAAQAGKPVTCGTRMNTGRIQFGGRTLSEFARELSGMRDLGRSVIDRTGLDGNWDFELTYTPDRPPTPQPGREPPAYDPNGPSMFAAMQEQLGLKLESIRGPVEVLVVDRVEKLAP